MGDVVMPQLAFPSDALPIDDHAVRAVAIRDERLTVLAFDDRVESADAVIRQHQIVSCTSADADEWLGQFKHAPLSIGRRDDDAAHELLGIQLCFHLRDLTHIYMHGLLDRLITGLAQFNTIVPRREGGVRRSRDCYWLAVNDDFRSGGSGQEIYHAFSCRDTPARGLAKDRSR